MAWTALQVRDKVRRDLDIDEDELVADPQMYEFINDAIRDMVSEMLKLGIEDKYYETNAKLSIVANQEEYSFPTDMFVTKLYKLIYERSGARELYAVKRLRGMQEYEKYHAENQYPTSNPQYRYKILNRTGEHRLLLVPKPLVSETNVLTVWYARKPLTVATSTDLVDVPEELISYIITFVKVECLKKDVGNPLLQASLQELARIRQLMVDTLTDQTHDGDNEVEQDISHYEAMGAI